jgi:osmoprotectant transport system ATP-binding protein
MNRVIGQPTIIELSNIHLRYGNTVALSGVDLSIPENRVTVIIGPSGCGKSSTLRCINALVRPEAGEILFQGKNIWDGDVIELRRQMGYVIQHVGLMPHMSVEENVGLVPRLLGIDAESQRSRSRELLSLVKLDPDVYASKYPDQLSGGESQRVGVARALGADPPVLLMDEPFGAVDPLTREILQDEFIRIQRQLKKTVIFVTHDLDEAVRLADYLVIMKEGTVVQADAAEQILKEPSAGFVEDFLGSDRALKRLTLYTADLIMTPVGGDDAVVEWNLDHNKVPVAGKARVEGSEIVRQIDPASHTVKEYSSLKECMSKILALGLPAVPVVDESYRCIGEVSYEQIRRESIS